MGNFGKMMKELRRKSGLTQDELAGALGLSKSTISMYENGNREPDFETLEAITEYFRVDMNYLLGKDQAQGGASDLQLDGVYLSFARQAQDEGIDPRDIQTAIEMIRRVRNER